MQSSLPGGLELTVNEAEVINKRSKQGLKQKGAANKLEKRHDVPADNDGRVSTDMSWRNTSPKKE